MSAYIDSLLGHLKDYKRKMCHQSTSWDDFQVYKNLCLSKQEYNLDFS